MNVGGGGEKNVGGGGETNVGEVTRNECRGGRGEN